MNRAVKKLVYGFIYLSILGAIGAFIYFNYFGPDPATCTDGILNQGEVQVDCGGPCEDCELKTLKLDIGGVDVIRINDKTSFLVEFENPSINYGALNVPYSFKYSDSNNLPKEIEGEFFVDPGESGYVAQVGLDVSSSPAVSFGLGDFEFQEAESIELYQLGTREIEIEFPEEGIDISGLVLNDSTSDIESLRILVLFKDEQGKIVNIGQTIISDLPSFDRKDFLISIPHDGTLIDKESTEIFLEVLN